MSFSLDVKNELIAIEGMDTCCQKAELFGLLRMSGAVSLTGSGLGINFTTENAALARRILHLLKENFNVTTEVVITRLARLKKNNRYKVQVIPSEEAREALRSLYLLLPAEEGRKKLLRKACCRKAFLRGVFLTGGSVNKPSGDYHLEMVTENEELGKVVLKVMQYFSIQGRLIDRKNDYVVYLKGGDAIQDFLAAIGAHESLCYFENVRIVKDVRNNVNRCVNCETANLNKTVQAAVRQIKSIKYIELTKGFKYLNPILRETAELRMENPEMPLGELAALLKGNISKSGLNHRLAKLEAIARELGMEREEF